MPYHPAVARPVALLLLVVAWVLTWRPALDPDLWWHLAVGARILDGGGIPTTEPWSWWTGGAPFLAHSWLWDLASALAFRAGGLVGVSVLGAAVSGAAVLLLWLLLGLARPSLSPIVRALLVVGAVLTAVVAWSPRAQALDLVAVLGVVVAWGTYVRGGGPRILVTIPGTALLWANLHGSAAPTGLAATLLACWVGTYAGERLGSWPMRGHRPLGVASLAALLALVLNPAGFRLLTYPLDPTVASAFNPAITEWRMPDLLSLAYLPFTIVLVGTVVAIVIPAVRRHLMADPVLLLLALGWTVAALLAARFVLLAGPLLVALTGPAVVELARRPARAAPDLAGLVPRPAWLLTGLAAIVVAAAGWTLIAPTTQDRLVAARFPQAAADRIQSAGCAGRLLNAYDWGGFLLSRGIEVGAYGNSPGWVVDAQAGLEAGATDPAAVLAEHAIDLVLVHADGPLGGWLRAQPGWRIALEDDVAMLAVRQDHDDCQMLYAQYTPAVITSTPNAITSFQPAPSRPRYATASPQRAMTNGTESRK